MKKIITSSLLVASIMFTGCANTGMGTSTVGAPTVNQEFQTGYVVSQKKVLVSKTMTSALTGAGVGALGGALIGSKNGGGAAVKGGLIGAGLGAGVGVLAGMATNNNEVESYETIINSQGRDYKVYLDYSLRQGTKLEFVVREDQQITNINLAR